MDAQEQQLAKKAKKLGITLLDVAQADKEMTEKLLSGWTLLDKTCPISGYPLLGKEGKTWSVRCQMEVLAKEDTSNNVIQESSAALTSTIQPPEFKKEEKEVLRTQPASTLRGKATRTRDEQSKAISQKLLSGWALLGDDCPVTGQCPLMKDPVSGKLWSAAIDEFIDDTEEKENETNSNVQSSDKGNEKAFVPDVSVNVAEKKPQSFLSSDKQSQLLSEKLLQGWSMLEEECPISGQCPLMMEPGTKRKWSAAINNFIDDVKQETNMSELQMDKKPIDRLSPKNEKLTSQLSTSEFCKLKMENLLKNCAIQLEAADLSNKDNVNNCVGLMNLMQESIAVVEKLNNTQF